MTLTAQPGGAALEQAARDRLGPAEADAFLARLEQLSFDITEPLEQVYGAAAGDGGSLIAGLIMDALDAAPGGPPRCGCSTGEGRSTRPGSSGPA